MTKHASEVPEGPKASSSASGIKCRSDKHSDYFEGSAQALISCGIVRSDQLPGSHGNGKTRCTFDAAGHRVRQGTSSSSFTPGRLTVTRLSATRFRVAVNIPQAEREERRALEAEAQKPSAFVRPRQVSEDTVACLQELLVKAMRGEIVGLAFAALHPRRQYIIDTAGECHRDPTSARGMIMQLSDLLGRRARGEEEQENDDD